MAALALLVTGVAFASATSASAASYDATVLADAPMAYWPLAGTAADASGRGHGGAFVNGTPTAATMPNGDSALRFSGAGEYVSVATSPELSIPTSGSFTWEGWIRPDTLQFSKSTGGYVDWMGKCLNYSPNCEWEARMYNQVNSQNRESRLSAYAFNPSAGLGSGADWQPVSGTIASGQWLHVVGEYQVTSTPGTCNTAYPGTIDIWVDGVKWNSSYHRPTGCMSQYSVSPQVRNSPVTIGMMSFDSSFQGAIGKVAVYDHLLSDAQIMAHYAAMTGGSAAGSCLNECTLAVGPLVSASATSSPTATTATTSAPASPAATSTAAAPVATTTSSTASPASAPVATTTTSSPTPTTSSPAASVSTATSSPSPTATATTSGPVTATWTMGSSWDTGYCASVTIRTTSAVTSWKVTIAVPGTVNNVWDAVGKQTGALLALRNASYNGKLTPSKPVTAGFCAAR